MDNTTCITQAIKQLDDELNEYLWHNDPDEYSAVLQRRLDGLRDKQASGELCEVNF